MAAQRCRCGIVSVVLVTCFALPQAARAQPASPAEVAQEPSGSSSREIDGLEQRGSAERIAGILLTLAGVGLGIAGGLVLRDCCSVPSNVSSITSATQIQPLVDDARNKLITGGVLAGVGFGSLVTGVTLIAVGQSNINTARRLGRNLSLAPAPGGAIGGSLRWDF